MTDRAFHSLAGLQTRLQNYVLGDGDPGDLVSELSVGSSDQCKRRLNIYHAGYRLRMTEVLQGAFENTWAYLGDEAFDALCTRYIHANPSHSPNLRGYGCNFPPFLHLALPGDPEVAELATMDWRLQDAFDAPNAPILTGEKLATIDEAEWRALGFVLHPSVSLARFEWNAKEIWHAIDQGITPPAAERLNAPIGHLFWRSDQRSYFRTLEENEFAALDALHDGLSFARVCEQLAENDPDSAIDASVGTWLARWLADGLLSEIGPAPGH